MKLLFLSLLYALAITGVGALLITRWIPLPWYLLSTAAVAFGFLSDLRGQYLLHPRMNRALLGTGILLMLLDYRLFSHHILITVMDLMLYVIALRLLSPKANRDLMQILALSFFCLLGAAALTTDLLYGAFFLLYSFLLPWGLLAISVKAELEGERDLLRGKVAEKKPLTLPPGFALVFTRGIFTKMILAIGVTLLMTVLFFTFFPRFTIGQLAGKLTLTQPLTGFATEVRLGELGKILSDPTPVARVQFGEGKVQEFYLRGIVLDTFDGKTWIRTRKGSSPLYSSEGKFTLVREEYASRSATIYLEDTGTRILFTIPWTLGLTLPSHQLEVSPDGVLMGRELTYPYRYHLQFLPAYERSYPWGQRTLPYPVPPGYSRYLQLPPRELLPEEIFRHSQERTAAWVQGALEEFSRFHYTLDLTPSEQPLHAFFQRREGHCELFATALALMLRASGIPSRLVSGFRGGEYMEGHGYFLVRQRNAHSWVEAWVPEEGWIPLDPTPPAPLPGNWYLRVREKLQRAVEVVRFLWMEYIVDYDLRSQKELLKRSRARLLSLKGRQFFGDWQFEVKSLLRKTPGQGGGGVFLLMAGVGLLLFFMLLWRSRKERKRRNPLEPLLLKLEALLGARPPFLPFPLWIARSSLPGELKQACLLLYRQYAAFTYGKEKGSPPPEFSQQLRTLLRALERERRRGEIIPSSPAKAA